MLKSGLISGAVMFILVLIGAAGLTPLCALCVPLLTGLLAGYLTGVFEKPAAEQALLRGAGAGAIAGGMAVVANILAAIINAAVLQNPQFQLNRVLGLPPTDSTTVWIVQLGLNLCIGLFNVAFTAALGAGGAAIWRGTAAKEQNLPPAPLA
jgi:hypothetical protein